MESFDVLRVSHNLRLVFPTSGISDSRGLAADENRFPADPA